MTDIDIEKLPVDLHGIALANGLPSGITAHPAFKSFMREYKQALAALVLKEAAKVCDVTPPEPFRPSIEAAHALRTIAEGLKP